MRTLRSPIVLAAFAATLLLCAHDAFARGTVLQVADGAVYVDLGANDGVDAGSELDVFHVIQATNPVTKQVVRDTFLVGVLTVERVGKEIGVARGDSAVMARVVAGDEVEARAKKAVIDPWLETTRPRRPRAEKDAEARRIEAHAVKVREHEAQRVLVEQEIVEVEAARRAFEASLGKDILERIAIWNQLIADLPADSEVVRFAAAEIGSLRSQEVQREQATERRALEMARPEFGALAPLVAEPGIHRRIGELWFDAPTQLYEGSSFELAFLAPRPEFVKGAWVHYRASGADTYRRVALTVDGDGYLRAVIPGDAVRPGGVEYFVEVLDVRDEGAEPRAVAGSAGLPERIDVDASVEEPPPDRADRSRVTLSFDYIDFDGTDSKWDQYLQAEADFLYRFRTALYSLRLGFTTLGGRGGPKDVIKNDPVGCLDADGTLKCHRARWSLGYVELEFRLGEIVAFMVRPLVGGGYRSRSVGDVFDDDRVDPDDFGGAFGLRGRLRIGREQQTNLVLGASASEQFGSLFEAAFTWDVIPRFPIVLSANVTNQLVGEDYGVRLIADVGWRGMSWLYPSVRFAYQARDIEHAGVSGGLALNFDW